MPLSKVEQAKWMREYRAKKKTLGITTKKTRGRGIEEQPLRYCAACGEDRTVDIHHIDGNHDNNSKDNLIDLCPTCHSILHRRKISINELLYKTVIPSVIPNNIVKHDVLVDADGQAIPDYC